MEKYANRTQAGQFLAQHLTAYAHRNDVIVLGLPRGGVPVAFEVAKALVVPLDVFIVRKLGVPHHEELAMGAIATGGTIIFNEEVINELKVPKTAIERVIESEKNELNRREITYRGNKPFEDLQNKTIILVDDGIATGATMRAAIAALRLLKTQRIMVAVPVAAFDTCEKISKSVDDLICPIQSHSFYAVGQWYDDFTQTTDEEVSDLLKKAHAWSDKT